MLPTPRIAVGKLMCQGWNLSWLGCLRSNWQVFIRLQVENSPNKIHLPYLLHAISTHSHNDSSSPASLQHQTSA